MAAAASSPGCESGKVADARPHGIVLIGLDTLRADGLSVYGNPRPTSPVIDRLAQKGVLFENAVSHAATTLPGFVGILTGSYPSTRVFDRRLKRSLVERIRDAGYATAAFTEGGFVSRQFGFNRGFEHYWEEEGEVVMGRPRRPSGAVGGIARTFAEARRWLREHAREPFFLFIHTYEVHTPYRRLTFAADLPRGVLGRAYRVQDVFRVMKQEIPVTDTEIAYVRALYDGGVTTADRYVGELLATLDELGVANDTVVALTSDHGEALGERRPIWLGRHDHGLYDPLLRVPLILHDPRVGYPRSRVSAQVRTIDILPTLLELAGIEVNASVDGRSLLPLMRGEDDADRFAFSEHVDLASNELRHTSLRLPGAKLIVNHTSSERPPVELYDLRNDPRELRNLADERSEQTSQLHALLKQQRSAIGERRGLDPTGEITDELKKRLESLGYVE